MFRIIRSTIETKGEFIRPWWEMISCETREKAEFLMKVMPSKKDLMKYEYWIEEK